MALNRCEALGRAFGPQGTTLNSKSKLTTPLKISAEGARTCLIKRGRGTQPSGCNCFLHRALYLVFFEKSGFITLTATETLRNLRNRDCC
jgi:hypothetical protein